MCVHTDREKEIENQTEREEKEQVEYLASSMMPSISQLFGTTPHLGNRPL